MQALSRGTLTQAVIFDRIFIEPPTISTYLTRNEDGKFTNTNAINITTSGCTITVYHDSSDRANCTVQWTAIGLVKKQLS